MKKGHTSSDTYSAHRIEHDPHLYDIFSTKHHQSLAKHFTSREQVSYIISKLHGTGFLAVMCKP